jgi:hypothetical protein
MITIGNPAMPQTTPDLPTAPRAWTDPVCIEYPIEQLTAGFPLWPFRLAS